MKKLILLWLVALLCLSPAAVLAAGIEGAETQGKGKFSLGISEEYVFDRKLKTFSETESFDSTVVYPKAKPKLDWMSRTMLKANFGLFDWLDIYAKVGIADFKAKGDISGNWVDTATGETGSLAGDLGVKSGIALAFGGGLKIAYPLGKGWLAGSDFQYLRHRKKVSGSGAIWDVSDPTETIPINLDGKMTVQEWHIAPFIAKKLGNFTPYIGAKYSDLRMKLDYDDNGSDNFDAKRHFGAFAGTNLTLGKKFSLNLEGRFIDETAMSLGISYRF